MKRITLYFLFSSVLSSFICDLSFAAEKAETIFNASSPFQTNVFVENLGQFDGWAKTEDSIKYALNCNDKIFFTQQGLTIKLEKKENGLSAEKQEEMERRGESEPTQVYYVHMKWEGCNENPAMEVSEALEGYYTFGEKGFENIKAKGYRKLVYKELYPGIDAEYIVPAQGGIKYSLIIHPGADISKVKMNYSGDVDKISLSSDGNILVKTPAGEIIDHAPQSFYKHTSEKIKSAFELKGNLVSFYLEHKNNFGQTIILDPWTATPTGLSTNNAAFDVDYDNNGNVYVSGGSFPYKVSKYSSAGTFLWTFTFPPGWANTYSRFCLLRQSGTMFIGEGFNSGATPRVMKVKSNGVLQTTSAPLAGTNEIWKMFYNFCTGKLIAFGGGTSNTNNLQLIADTNLTSSVPKNFNGFGAPGACCNDITSVDMDNNGDFYAITSSSSGLLVVNNKFMKSLNSTTYNPPCAFNVATAYDFQEITNNGIPGFAGQITVRANAVTLNAQYAFTYDGKTLIAWNKTTGANLGSVIVNAGYTGGQNRTHEGIDVDPCNNVYVGGPNKVHVYNFNGTTFTAGTPITTTITGEVYDVCLGPFNKLYVCGAGFVSELLLSSVNCNQINLTISATNSSCGGSTGSATVVASGGTPPYTYLWNPSGQTTSTATGLSSGTYTVTVSDASSPCSPGGSTSTATVTVVSVGNFSVTSTQVNVTCNVGSDGSGTVSATGGVSPYTYNWLPSGGTTTAVSGLSAGTYTAIVTDASGCTNPQIITITQPTAITATATSTQTSCAGNTGTATVNASGGTGAFTYSWSSGGQVGATATGLGFGTYTATITDANGCTQTQTVTVNQPSTVAVTASATPTPCGVSNGTATAAGSGGALPYTYSWSPGSQTGSTATGLSAGTYTAIITDAGGCTNTTTVSVVTSGGGPVANAGIDVTISYGNSATLTATGGGTYAWNTGQVDSVIFVAPLINTIYCVSVTANSCTDTACVTVYVEPMDCGFSDEQLFVPDAFSPNNDTKNDVLGVYYPNVNCIKEFFFIVYDRWGERVFESTSIASTWDGTYAGKMMNTAVFVYYMRVKFITEKETIRKGNVSLIR